MIVRRHLVVLCLIVMILPLAGLAGIAQAAGKPLVVAYLDGDTLYAWQQGDSAARQIAAGSPAHPRLSPDEARVAYQRDGTLWVGGIDGSKPTPLITPESLNADKTHFVLDMAWLDDKTILFNTYRSTPKLLVKQQFADDLWQADLGAGTVTQLLDAGQGGSFHISPAGDHIALVVSGDYASQTPGSISVVDARGQNRVKLLEYPFVNTGASYQFYAQPQWLPDGSGLLVAIPDPNLVYASGSVPPTALWRLDVTGKAVQLGSVNADFFSLPEFSPDGKRILYTRRLGAKQTNEIALFQAASDGTGEQEIAHDRIGAIEPAHWTPDGAAFTFVHGNPGELWLQAKDGLRRFPSEQDIVFDLTWADASTFVFSTSPGGTGEIRYGVLGQSTTRIAQRTTGGEFDARRGK